MTAGHYRELLSGFMRCLEEGAYFEAHTMLEEIWFPRRFEEDKEMQLLRGFINASVSFELLKRGRPEAAERVWKTYLKYLPLLEGMQSRYRDVYRQIVVAIEKVNAKW